MKKALKFALGLLALPAMMAAQERRPWSFYIEGGVGIQQLAELKNIDIPEGDARTYLNKRGIYSIDITTGRDKLVVPNINIGASYNPRNFLQGRSRISLHLGNQNISQLSYHAGVISAEVLLGYDVLRHPHHDLSIELGVGAYATFNSMNYTWRGLDGEGKQIYIGGVPEQISVNLGSHNTVQPSVPLRISYTYNIGAHSWIGVYAQGRYIPRHDCYVPTYTASAGITYRFTPGRKKQAYVKQEPVPRMKVPCIDTIYVHDTLYLDKPSSVQSVSVLFELNSSEITEYELVRLQNMSFPEDAGVELTGYVCNRESAEHHSSLARKRVDAVKQLLKSRGVRVVATHTETSGYAAPNFRSVEIKCIEK